MGETKVDVLARIRSAVVMADNVNDAKDMREVFGIVAELIDADHEYDAANEAYSKAATGKPRNDAWDRVLTARARRDAALARIGAA